MRSFSIQSFGCRVNQAEAFHWADELQKNGLEYEEDFFRSDLIVVNSCTLTSRADSDVRKFIRTVARMNPKAHLIVTGCYLDRAPDEFKDMPQIWRSYSNKEKSLLVKDLISSISSQKSEPRRFFRSRALVKIQDGCDFRCTFCVIPRVRGGSVSVEKDEILAQIRRCIDQRFREVVLTGIHLCSYGLDLQPKSSFLDLLEEIEGLQGLARARLSSLDPRFLNVSLLDHLTKSERLCPHFHLSLQNGSEDVLRRMGRKVKIEDYKDILNYLRRHCPQASLGADIIVGFPGEKKEDFEQTSCFLENSPLTYFHVFSYSPRPWTAAASWPQVDGKVKKERAARLRKLAAKKNLEFRRSFLGKECEAIVIKKKKEGAQVLTSNYLKVSVPCSLLEEREEVRVKITKVTSKATMGKIIPVSHRVSP